MSALNLIRPDFNIPGKTATFNTEVTLVTRDYHTYGRDEMPTLYFQSASTTGRHLLADVREETLHGTIAAFLAERGYYNAAYPSADQVDGLADDVLAVLTLDGTWGGLALRTRMGATSQSTQIEEQMAGFVKEFETDYIEYFPPDLSNQTIPAGAVNVNGQQLRTLNPSGPLRTLALDTFFNDCLQMANCVWVEQAEIWPIPFEQIPLAHTPGFFFQDMGETYQYNAATPVKKVIQFQSVLLAFEPDQTQFITQKEAWVSELKLLLGDNSDLRGTIADTGISEIRTDKSEYPLIHIEMDFHFMYVQSYLGT